MWCLPCKAQVRKVNAETTIRNVVIFSSGARVERSASVTLLPGRTEIAFPGLSNQLDQQSVQLQSDANVTLLSVQTTKDFLHARKIEQEEASFINRSAVVKDKLDVDLKLLEVFKNEESMLNKNEAIGGTSGVRTLELKEALDLHRQRLTEVYKQELDIQKRINSEQLESQRLTAELKEIGKKKDSVNYIVTALVDNKETKSVTFNLLYNVSDAGWYPTYDVRIADVVSPLNVMMNAHVFQRSGETWKDVSLRLSTGTPNDNATPSELQPWLLGFYNPSVSFRRQAGTPGSVSGRVSNTSSEPLPGASVMLKDSRTGVATDANGYFKLQNFSPGTTIIVSAVGYESKEVAIKPGYYGIILSPAKQELNEVVVTASGIKRSASALSYNTDGAKFKDNSLQFASVATQYQPTTTIYKIEDKYTLETDGKATTIGIRQFEVPAIYEYYTAPKIDPTAFLTAKVINWQDFDLQSGEASLYFEGSYLGKTYIDLSTTLDTLALSLGKDNGIKISRKLAKEYSSKRFIGSNRTDSRQYEISLRNTTRVPITITVKDQFPVSITKEISVNELNAPDAQIDKETGIVTWLLTIPPGQEKKLALSYNVKYPKDRVVLIE